MVNLVVRHLVIRCHQKSFFSGKSNSKVCFLNVLLGFRLPGKDPCDYPTENTDVLLE